MRRRIVFAVLLVIAAIYLLNASWLTFAPTGKPFLLAHRGVHQTYPAYTQTADDCTATMIRPPTHDLIENTLPSMKAAFEAGAEVVEFDIHPTTDGRFAVFHDWTVDCRTDGKGVTREHTLAHLKRLDIGYGYTADGGKTFPLRGKGVGLMPTLDEVLTAFPDRRFLIHIKSNDLAEGDKIAARLKQLPPDRLKTLMVYGGDRPVTVVREQLPQIPTMSNQQEMQCLKHYLAIGWAGYVPSSCAGRLLLIPRNYAWLLWGWPDRFLARMRDASAVVILAGRYQKGDSSTGIDTPEQYKAAPQRSGLGIWTNRIESIAASR